MTSASKFIFTVGTTIILLVAAYLLFALLPQLSRIPPLMGAHEIVYTDKNSNQLVSKVIHTDRGFILATHEWGRSLTRIEQDAQTRVAGATTQASYPNPLGNYTATITYRDCNRLRCTGENALYMKWKYSPFSSKIASGTPFSNFQWLDPHYFLVEGGGNIYLMDVAGKVYLTIPGQMYDIYPK